MQIPRQIAQWYLSCYPGYFWEPSWLSMGLMEISRVTWQVWLLWSEQFSAKYNGFFCLFFIHLECSWWDGQLGSWDSCLFHQSLSCMQDFFENILICNFRFRNHIPMKFSTCADSIDYGACSKVCVDELKNFHIAICVRFFFIFLYTNNSFV